MFQTLRMSQTLTFGDSVAPVTCHAWNKDRTRKYFIKTPCTAFSQILPYSLFLVT